MLLQHASSQLLQGILEIIDRRCGIHIGGVHHFLQIPLQHGYNGIGAEVHAKSGGNGLGIHRDHILEIQLGLVLFVKSAAGEYIHFLVFQLSLYDGRILRNGNHMPGQVSGIGYAGRKSRSIGTFLGTDDAHDFQWRAIFDHRLHMCGVCG